MTITLELDGKKYLFTELSFYGKDYKIRKYKSHAVINFKTLDNLDVSINDGEINQLLMKAKIIGVWGEISDGKTSGFKRDRKRQLLLNALDFSKINQNKPLLLIQLL